MRLGGGGYTIIEVLIFLAVSGMLLVTAALALGGTQGHAEFNTSMSDVNTKLQQWIDQVGNGFSGSTATASASSFNCNVDPASGYPQLLPGNAGRGTNSECIFLGKAIQVNADPTDENDRVITAYPVLGRRTYTVALPNGAGFVETAATDLKTAKPTAAIFPPHADLSERYSIENGVKVVSVQTIDNNGNVISPSSRLLGIFNSFNSESQPETANGDLSLLSVQYPYTQDSQPEADTVQSCIRLSAPAACATPAGPNLWPMSQMKVCFQSAGNGEQATLALTSSNGLGITTKLSFGQCGF